MTWNCTYYLWTHVTNCIRIDLSCESTWNFTRILQLTLCLSQKRCVYVNAPFVLIQLCAVQACLLIDCSNHSPAIQLHLLKQNNVFTQMLKIVFVTIYRTARLCVYMVRITTTDCIHDTSLLVWHACPIPKMHLTSQPEIAVQSRVQTCALSENKSMHFIAGTLRRHDRGAHAYKSTHNALHTCTHVHSRTVLRTSRMCACARCNAHIHKFTFKTCSLETLWMCHRSKSRQRGGQAALPPSWPNLLMQLFARHNH